MPRIESERYAPLKARIADLGKVTFLDFLCRDDADPSVKPGSPEPKPRSMIEAKGFAARAFLRAAAIHVHMKVHPPCGAAIPLISAGASSGAAKQFPTRPPLDAEEGRQLRGRLCRPTFAVLQRPEAFCVALHAAFANTQCSATTTVSATDSHLVRWAQPEAGRRPGGG